MVIYKRRNYLEFYKKEETNEKFLKYSNVWNTIWLKYNYTKYVNIHDNRYNVLLIFLFQIEIDNDEILKEIEEENKWL